MLDVTLAASTATVVKDYIFVHGNALDGDSAVFSSHK
jgi:hypothetical protein